MHTDREKMISDHCEDRVAIERGLRSWLDCEHQRVTKEAREIGKRMDALDSMYEDMQVGHTGYIL